jgi:hypothetical protein
MAAGHGVSPSAPKVNLRNSRGARTSKGRKGPRQDTIMLPLSRHGRTRETRAGRRALVSAALRRSRSALQPWQNSMRRQRSPATALSAESGEPRHYIHTSCLTSHPSSPAIPSRPGGHRPRTPSVNSHRPPTARGAQIASRRESTTRPRQLAGEVRGTAVTRR